MPIDFTFYLISDRTLCRPRTVASVVSLACRAGVRAVQLREKDLPPRELYALAMSVKRVTDRYEAALLVNDRADIAAAVGAAGVHLTEESIPVEAARAILGPDSLIGVSTHTIESAVAAETGGADFVTFGPIFQTRSGGPYKTAVGVGSLERVVARVSIPVFALGGVTADRAADCLAAGAGGIACISAVMGVKNVGDAVRAFEGEIGGLGSDES